jgi:hypothetical protein
MHQATTELLAFPALVPASRFTLWVVRRACVAALPLPPGSALIPMGVAFAEVLQPRQERRPGRDESRLLRATAAVQAGDLPLADNFLFKLAIERPARHRLTRAVITLADFVASRGHRLPLPASAMALPGAALQIARLHGRDLGTTAVSWPGARP